VKVRVPYHITGFWLPILKDDVYATGSLGAGVVLGTYVEAYPCARKLNDKVISRAFELLNLEDGVYVCLDEPRPVRVGYGASAARALAAALSVGLPRGLSFCTICREVHRAEVELGTGLGDVLAESVGVGVVYRIEPGAPCVGVADFIVPREDAAVITLPLGQMDTAFMLRQFRDRIVEAGKRAYSAFIRNPSFEKFLECAHRFSREVGFLSREYEEMLLKALSMYLSRGDVLGYFIKKRLLVLLVEKRSAVEIADILSMDVGAPVYIDPISLQGIHIVYERAGDKVEEAAIHGQREGSKQL